MIKLLVKGKQYGNLVFDTDDIEFVIDTMQERCKKANHLIFNSRSLWKVREDKLIHETMVSYSEFEIVTQIENDSNKEGDYV